MSSASWADYLADASEHLRASRRAVEEGVTSPDPPTHPAGPLPQDLEPQARRLALAYDQLALEVATRMTDIECRLATPRVEAPTQPHYVDQKA
jgi:hypothetical protein